MSNTHSLEFFYRTLLRNQPGRLEEILGKVKDTLEEMQDIDAIRVSEGKEGCNGLGIAANLETIAIIEKVLGSK